MKSLTKKNGCQTDGNKNPVIIRIIEFITASKSGRLIFFVVMTILISGAAGVISFKISNDYYTETFHHNDSASYRIKAMFASVVKENDGLSEALRYAMGEKDSLDISIRLLTKPDLLLLEHGHLIVLIPFMACFIFLLITYSYGKTGRLSFAILLPISILTFKQIYVPYMGIADLWKDNLACWLLGAAIISWLLSEKLSNRKWNILCGFFLGGVILQRTGLAVYFAILFIPVFLHSAYCRFKIDKPRIAASKISSLTLPVFLFGATVLFFQWKKLYIYYFKMGYAWGSALDTYYILIDMIERYIGFPILIAIFVVICLSLSHRKSILQNDHFMTVLWFLIGFPMLNIVLGTMYHGFAINWSILFIILIATLLP